MSLMGPGGCAAVEGERATAWLDRIPKTVPVAMLCPNSRMAEAAARLDCPSGWVAWWRKTNPRPNGPDREPIVLRGFPLLRGRTFEAYNGDTTHHPCEKPLSLMRWLVLTAPVDGRVLDPFAGSGTTGVACVLEGRRFLGIEQEERYVEIARRRIADAAAQGSLFAGMAPKEDR